MKDIKELITTITEWYLIIVVVVFIVGGSALGAFLAANASSIDTSIGAIIGFFAGTLLTALIAGPIVLLMELRDATRATAAALNNPAEQ